jgi:SET domain-containing protein
VWRFEKGVDMEFAPDLVERFPEHVRAFFSRYGYVDRSLNRLILCFDDARFVNHSDTPNVAGDYERDPHGLDVALRDIAAGEEITMDYAGFEEAGRAL